jgi:glycosyltransferase involved in cell wall biosynthesis
MKVWIVNQYALPPTQSGGTRHFSLAKGLRDEGIEVEIIASSRNYLSGAEIPEAAGGEQTFDGVSYTFLKSWQLPLLTGRGGRLGAMLAFAITLRAHLKARSDSPGVVLGSAPTLFVALVAYWEARRRGVPFVLEVRDIWPQTLIDLGGYSPSHPGVLLFGMIERFLYKRADHIITLLPYAGHHIAAHGGEPDSVTWIPNGIDLGLAGPVRPTKRTPERPFVVKYVGAQGLANALDAVLDAADLLQRHHGERFQFVMVGDGHEKERLRHRAAAEGIRTVAFQPAVPKAEVYDHLAAADALIVNMNPGSLYRFGISFNKLYDYLAAGRPVVFGSAAVNDPIAEAGAGLCVPANDAEALVGAIEQLAAMTPMEREAMGARGRAYVEANHDMKKLAQRLAGVFREVSA